MKVVPTLFRIPTTLYADGNTGRLLAVDSGDPLVAGVLKRRALSLKPGFFLLVLPTTPRYTLPFCKQHARNAVHPSQNHPIL